MNKLEIFFCLFLFVRKKTYRKIQNRKSGHPTPTNDFQDFPRLGSFKIDFDYFWLFLIIFCHFLNFFPRNGNFSKKFRKCMKFHHFRQIFIKFYFFYYLWLFHGPTNWKSWKQALGSLCGSGRVWWEMKNCILSLALSGQVFWLPQFLIFWLWEAP